MWLCRSLHELNREKMTPRDNGLRLILALKFAHIVGGSARAIVSFGENNACISTWRIDLLIDQFPRSFAAHVQYPLQEICGEFKSRYLGISPTSPAFPFHWNSVVFGSGSIDAFLIENKEHFTYSLKAST